MFARGFRLIGASAIAVVIAVAAATAQLSPADEARLKKLDAGPKIIDVSKYPPEQQQAYKLFESKCSSCHVIARGVNSEMVVPVDWERYIKRMMYKPNSGISNDQGRILFRFLTYDASVRKADLLRKALVALPAADRAAAIERIKAVNPGFVAP